MEPVPSATFQFCPVCGAPYDASQSNQANKACSACGFILYENQSATVGAVILYQDKVLLIRRAVDPYQGQWDIPGGFVDPGESLVDALKREVEEETGLTPRLNRMLGPYGPTWYVYQGRGMYNTDFYYLMESDTDQITVGDDAASGQWFDWNALPPDEEIGFPSVRHVLQDLAPELSQQKQQV